MLGILNRINVVVPMITICIRPRMREALLGHTESYYYYYASTEDSPIEYYWIETVVVCADVVLPIGYTSCTFFIRWTLLQIPLTILAGCEMYKGVVTAGIHYPSLHSNFREPWRRTG